MLGSKFLIYKWEFGLGSKVPASLSLPQHLVFALLILTWAGVPCSLPSLSFNINLLVRLEESRICSSAV